MSQRLHLGCTPWLTPIGRRADELLRQASLAETLGYESFWLPENHFSGEGAIPEPLMLLAAVAAGTRTIRLGTTSYLLPLRHPVAAAEQVAVLDQLSAGRVILGVGRGFAPGTFDAFNVKASEKREIFAESLALMRRAWQGEAISDDGTTLIWPRPVQTPHPPIWVAAFGPKALEQAGRLGLPYLASPMESRATLKINYGRHADACDAAAMVPPTTVPIMRTVFVSEDSRSLDRVRQLLEAQLAAFARGGSTIARAAPKSVDDWAIVGRPADVAEVIDDYQRELGMSHLIATRLRVDGVPGEEFEQSLQLLAEINAEEFTQ